MRCRLGRKQEDWLRVCVSDRTLLSQPSVPQQKMAGFLQAGVESEGSVPAKVRGKQYTENRRMKVCIPDDVTVSQLAPRTWQPGLYPGSRQGLEELLSRETDLTRRKSQQRKKGHIGKIREQNGIGFSKINTRNYKTVHQCLPISKRN